MRMLLPMMVDDGEHGGKMEIMMTTTIMDDIVAHVVHVCVAHW